MRKRKPQCAMLTADMVLPVEREKAVKRRTAIMA